MPPPDVLAQAAHPLLNGLLFAAFGLYVLAFVVAMARPRWGRWPLLAGVVVHLAGSIGRGVAIEYLPLTNKMESFSAAALAVALVAVVTWRPVRRYVLPMLAVALAAFATALRFPLDLAFAPPLMYTVWYPIHVPLSFLAYGLWTAAAAGAVAWLVDRDREWLQRIQRWSLQGFGLWSASMICGGIWGVVAWGAYFLWDPKVVWSVILWFHYATFLHVRHVPSLRDRDALRPVLALVGFLFVFIAYVGTSFFFGGASHAF